jgi:hypothetical protein
MFYGKDTIENNFTLLLNKLGEQELFLFEPMPSYKKVNDGLMSFGSVMVILNLLMVHGLLFIR